MQKAFEKEFNIKGVYNTLITVIIKINSDIEKEQSEN